MKKLTDAELLRSIAIHGVHGNETRDALRLMADRLEVLALDLLGERRADLELSKLQAKAGV